MSLSNPQNALLYVNHHLELQKCYNFHKQIVNKSHIHNMQECPLYTLPLPMNSFSKATIKCALPTNTMTHIFRP
jgi:hypothetical protein